MRSHTPIAVIVVGLVLIAVGMLMQQVMPLLGRAAYQAAAAGSYSANNYHLDLTGYNVVAGLIIVLGVVALFADLRGRSGQRRRNNLMS